MIIRIGRYDIQVLLSGCEAPLRPPVASIESGKMTWFNIGTENLVPLGDLCHVGALIFFYFPELVIVHHLKM